MHGLDLGPEELWCIIAKLPLFLMSYYSVTVSISTKQSVCKVGCPVCIHAINVSMWHWLGWGENLQADEH